jgi:hypothetical protein
LMGGDHSHRDTVNDEVGVVLLNSARPEIKRGGLR